MLKAFNHEIYRLRAHIQFCGYVRDADRECEFLKRILLEELRAVDMQNGRIEREMVIVVDKIKKQNQIKLGKQFQVREMIFRGQQNNQGNGSVFFSFFVSERFSTSP